MSSSGYNLMKGIWLFTVCICVHSKKIYEPITRFYHDEIGIPEAARIKAIEENPNESTDSEQIVGGSQASLGQFPYQAGLVIALKSGATSLCGASLLSNTRALTAAHCWSDGSQTANQFTVVLGATTLFSGGTRVTTSNVKTHEKFNHSKFNNDIAMIILPRVDFNNNIKPIVLPSGSLTTNKFVGEEAEASGYGATSDTSGVTSKQTLSHVRLTVITNDLCTRSYGPDTVISSVMCTDGSRGRNTCGGDSGGPLAYTDGNKMVLIGIISFGSSSGCEGRQPSGYSRVTSFLSWIRDRM